MATFFIVSVSGDLAPSPRRDDGGRLDTPGGHGAMPAAPPDAI
jgi:hypothetical protein